MPLPTQVQLPPASRPVGGILSASRPIAGEWWRGIVFTSPQCLAPQAIGACTNGEVDKTFNRQSDIAEFAAFGVLQAVECTSVGRSGLGDLAGLNLDVTREYAIAQELLTGAASGNPSLSANAAMLGAAADPVAALGCLDQRAGQALSGRLAYIHVPPIVGNALLAEGAIWRDGRLWRTALGSVVVISAGYDGRGPDAGEAPGAGDELFMYATGEVFANFGNRETVDATTRPVNTAQALAEEAAVIAFDPCYVEAIDSGLTMCAGVTSA